MYKENERKEWRLCVALSLENIWNGDLKKLQKDF